MTNEDDIKLKVCKKCDAPLPCDALKLSYFNLNFTFVMTVLNVVVA